MDKIADSIEDESIFYDEPDEKEINIIGQRYGNRINMPWVEKYRPKRLDDIIQQDEIIRLLKKTLETGELPHLLFYGPAGTGKTSTILALSYQLFGPNILKDRVIELNASDDRGIEMVRIKIIKNIKYTVSAKDPNYPCPDFRLIILDEADAMTPEAQSALRKIMETSSHKTRFCFICNYNHQIIEPISSRCTQFKFSPLSNHAIKKRLKIISSIEGIKINSECLDKIIELSEGDVRKAIMKLQNAKYITNYKKKISVQDIIDINGAIDTNDDMFKKMWKICSNGTLNDIQNLAQLLIRNSIPYYNVLLHLTTSVLKSDLSDKIKSRITIELSYTDRKLTEGCDEYVQIYNIMLYINSLIKSD